jgi:hypothetical protein
VSIGTGLSKDVEQFAARLKRKRSEELVRDPVAFRREAVRAFSASLSPGPGRRPEARVTLAANLRGQGKSWQEIYPVCIKSYSRLNVDSQRVEAENLRSAVRTRRNAQRRRNSPANSSGN